MILESKANLFNWESKLNQVSWSFIESQNLLVLIRRTSAQNREEIWGCGAFIHDTERRRPFRRSN